MYHVFHIGGPGIAGNGPHLFLGVFLMVLFWGLVFLGLAALLRGRRHGHGGYGIGHAGTCAHVEGHHLRDSSDAEEIVRLRFARGEIDEATFTSQIAALRQHRD